MLKALERAKHLIDPPIYVPPMKRWKRLGPYLAGFFWILILGGGAAVAFLAANGF